MKFVLIDKKIHLLVVLAVVGWRSAPSSQPWPTWPFDNRRPSAPLGTLRHPSAAANKADLLAWANLAHFMSNLSGERRR